MNVADWGLKVLAVFSPVLLAGLSWLSVKAAQLITAKVKNEYLRGVLVRLDDAVLNGVREVQQVTVDAMKSANPDGTLTADQGAKVKQAAIDSIKSHLGTKGLGELAQVLGLEGGAIEKVLATRVEAAVHDLRTSTPDATASDGGPGPAVVPSAA